MWQFLHFNLLTHINCIWHCFVVFLFGGCNYKCKEWWVEERNTNDSKKGNVGCHSSKWLRADCFILGGIWQSKDLSGQEVSADHLRRHVCAQTDEKEGEKCRKVRLACLLPKRLKRKEGRRTREQGWESEYWWNTALTKGEWEWECETQMGRKRGGRERQREGGKAVTLARPSSLPPRLCWQCHAPVKTDYQSPAWGCVYGHSHYLCPANKWHCCLETKCVWSPHATELLNLDVAGKM